MATYVTDDDIRTALGAHLKLADPADIPDSADAAVPSANQSAYDEIRGRLIGRGFTATQVDSWDRRAEFNRDIALFWCLVHAANLSATDVWVGKLDRRAELDTVAVAIDGVVVLPGATTGGQFIAGRLNTNDQVVTLRTKW